MTMNQETFFFAIVDENGIIQNSYQRDYRYQTYYESEEQARHQRFDDQFVDQKYRVKKFKLVEVEL